MDEDRTGSVGVRQAAITKAVAMSTLNIKAANREQMNQPKAITIARLESALDSIVACRTVISPDREHCAAGYGSRFCNIDDMMDSTKSTEKKASWPGLKQIRSRSCVTTY
jgi:hypothetical protein